MDTILETDAAVEAVRVPTRHTPADRPDPAWMRGRCPGCGEPLVSGVYYVGGRGYLIVWHCWASLKPEPTCQYRKIL